MGDISDQAFVDREGALFSGSGAGNHQGSKELHEGHDFTVTAGISAKALSIRHLYYLHGGLIALYGSAHSHPREKPRRDICL